jgi:hypothetical protein
MPHDHPEDPAHARPAAADPASADSRSGEARVRSAGHNRLHRHAAQWQDPAGRPLAAPLPEPDFDLVENAFCAAAAEAGDPTSLLRLARVPFVADLGDGRLMRLLSFRIEAECEVGSATPGFETGDVVYHPLPASRVTRRRHLSFVYHTPDGLREFALAELWHLRDLANREPG